uniref:RRM domain-containing protein n=1 Tax=Oryza brachyantha TaxID=4533 RepID=J3LJR5_ORYBR
MGQEEEDVDHYERRKAVSDLEERERAFAAGQPVDATEAARREDKRKAADVKRELEEFFASKQSAASGTASTPVHGAPQDAQKTDKGKILKVSWEGGADYYTAAKLEEIFKQFGEVEDVVIKTRKSRSRGSAIVVMSSKEAARSALQNHSVYNVFSVPLIVVPVEESSGVPARPTQTPETRTSNIGGTGFSDLEASVFRKLQEAQKRKQSG